MISLVIATHNDEADLVDCLSPLIAGSVEGLVRELLVSDAGSTDATLAIIEDAGGVLVEGGLEAACRAAKGPWLLVVEPKSRLPYDWIGPVRRHLERGGGKPARLVRGGWFAKPEAVLAPKQGYAPGAARGVRLKV